MDLLSLLRIVNLLLTVASLIPSFKLVRLVFEERRSIKKELRLTNTCLIFLFIGFFLTALINTIIYVWAIFPIQNRDLMMVVHFRSLVMNILVLINAFAFLRIRK